MHQTSLPYQDFPSIFQTLQLIDIGSCNLFNNLFNISIKCYLHIFKIWSERANKFDLFKSFRQCWQYTYRPVVCFVVAVVFLINWRVNFRLSGKLAFPVLSLKTLLTKGETKSLLRLIILTGILNQYMTVYLDIYSMRDLWPIYEDYT